MSTTPPKQAAPPIDYGDLPEGLAAAIATLIDAEKRAATSAARCTRCGHVDTLRVDDAEWQVLQAIRKHYSKGAS